MRDDRGRLEDILEAIKRVERYAKRGRKAFQTDELIQNWVIHHIQIIGEAAGKLSESLRKAHTEVPWPQIIKMRHVLVHDYFGIDLEEVWVAVERDLPVWYRLINLYVSYKYGSKTSSAGEEKVPGGNKTGTFKICRALTTGVAH